MTDPKTLAVYASKATDYAALVAHPTDDPARATFIAALPKGGQVLDLGCGPGLSAAAMAQAGLLVTAIDPVPEMIALAEKQEGVTARIGTFEDVGPPASWDGIWANFSLLHAPRSHLPRHLAAIAAALRPGGRLHIGMKTGTGEARDKLGRRYTYVTEEELRSLLNDAGLTPVAQWTGRDKGLDGELAPWIILHAVRNA